MNPAPTGSYDLDLMLGMNVLRKHLSRILHILGAILGAWLFIRVLSSVGWKTVLSSFHTHFDGLVVLTLCYFFYHLLRTLTLKICIPRKTHFRNLLAVRLAGEAVGFVAVGSVLGDAVKVALARDRIPASEGATGVFAEKLIYQLAGTIFIIGGLLIGLIYLKGGPLVFYAICIAIALFILVLVLLSSGMRPVSRILGWLRVRKAHVLDAVKKTEESLFRFRRQRPREFLTVLALTLLSYFYSVAEVLFILFILGTPSSFWNIWYYEGVVKFMNVSSVLVPGTLGVYEATNVALAKQLGLGAAAGMTVALFIRIRGLIWCAVGYICLLHLTTRKKPEKKAA